MNEIWEYARCHAFAGPGDDSAAGQNRMGGKSETGSRKQCGAEVGAQQLDFPTTEIPFRIAGVYDLQVFPIRSYLAKNRWRLGGCEASQSKK